ncbi:hypothetical protein K438DRAFT_1768160 [Mycena galopus ATCC 62051]|nr:hypothetical protein K438DRAFT_1768160 [Mycena galopus ATCC 62051]
MTAGAAEVNVPYGPKTNGEFKSSVNGQRSQHMWRSQSALSEEEEGEDNSGESLRNIGRKVCVGMQPCQIYMEREAAMGSGDGSTFFKKGQKTQKSGGKRGGDLEKATQLTLNNMPTTPAAAREVPSVPMNDSCNTKLHPQHDSKSASIWCSLHAESSASDPCAETQRSSNGARHVYREWGLWKARGPSEAVKSEPEGSSWKEEVKEEGDVGERKKDHWANVQETTESQFYKFRKFPADFRKFPQISTDPETTDSQFYKFRKFPAYFRIFPHISANFHRSCEPADHGADVQETTDSQFYKFRKFPADFRKFPQISAYFRFPQEISFNLFVGVQSGSTKTCKARRGLFKKREQYY